MGKSKTNLTKLETYQKKKKEMAEDLEYLRQVDVPASQGGGRKFVTDTIKEEERIKKEKGNRVKNYLESRKAQVFGYRDRLADYAFHEILKQLFPASWEYYCIPTDGSPLNVYGKTFSTRDGIVYILKSPDSKIYIRAVGITYDPEVDFFNVGIMITQIENTIDSWKGILLSDNKDTQATFKETKSGILLPK